MNNLGFAEGLIKGKIAEIIFSQMFRNEDKYSVIPFGYESITPELIQCNNSENNKEVKRNISTSPDFALISHDKGEILLVEVKYRKWTEINKTNIRDIASKQKDRWHPSWLFIAILDGFYFDSCDNIINNRGAIAKLSVEWINEKRQSDYLKLLNQFERG